jgi:hypothetical protein
MPTGTRRREFMSEFTRVEETFDAGKNWTTVASPVPFIRMGSQVTDSEGHRRLKSGAWDGGGPFYTSVVKRSFPTRKIQIASGSDPDRIIRGEFGTPFSDSMIPAQYSGVGPELFRSKDTSDLDSYGADAIALCSPTNPNANLGVAISEAYREGLPQLVGIPTWRQRTEKAKAAGSEFLNAEFGWMPLIKDVTDTASSVTGARDILKQYSRDSGRNVRREFTFPVETSEEDYSVGEGRANRGFNDGLPYPGYWAGIFGPGQITQSRKVETRRWFSGAFTYALPDQDDSWNGMHRNAADAEKLFGIGPDMTPEILWELTPWSWAADWFTNAQSVIHNVDSFALQGLIMRYGYMMEEHTVTLTNRFSSKGASPLLDLTSLPPSSITFRSKVRRVANPFGFGVTFDGLSPTQIAIAVALGIVLL